MENAGRPFETRDSPFAPYARALTRDVAAADDLVQDCLERAVSKSHLWQEGTDLRAWLFTILHNQHINDVRRAVRPGGTTAISDIEPEPALTSAPDQDSASSCAISNAPSPNYRTSSGRRCCSWGWKALQFSTCRSAPTLAAVARPRGIAPADGPRDRAGGNRARRRRGRPAPPSCLMMVTPPDRPL
jgi:Sigma-70 region 2